MKKETKKEVKGITFTKKEYVPPSVDVIWIELEQGFANSSTYISINKGDVNTEWEGEDNQEADATF
ncbi:hypothetical protein ELOC111193_17995 [Elizabethkingia occulta]|uniref:Uncharacterized protein n=1 Tax=Elizabethkingia occulta TaxID=1867263 RepID=A0A1T3MS33_9FLAO|nr:hypothetical protein [Elizabethkingia occulta]OPB87616.1 hypothetical protein BB020_03255 [Elizabethkingia occulta]OPC67428.1 hypothetical protein BAZ10_15310 [Elizabethkingia occulta]